MIVNAINNIKSNGCFAYKNQNRNYSFVSKSEKQAKNDFENYDKALSNINTTLINFKGTPKKLLDKLPPLLTYKDYKEVIERVVHSKTIYGECYWSLNPEYVRYRNIKQEHIGLLPYCGNNDVSYHINRYLSGRLQNEGTYVPSEETLCDIIRALDFSLADLDKDFGKFEGIVFRKGYFGAKPVQYASTSKKPAIASSFNGFDINAQYSVIRVKSAHKICDFQNKMNSSYAYAEAEVLIDRHAKHRLLKREQYDEELIAARKELAKFMYCDYLSGLNLPKINVPTMKKLLAKIKVYEEV